MGGILDTLRGEGTKRFRHEQRRFIGQERESDRLFGDASIAALQRGQAAQVGGYDQAISKASDISRGARRDAITRSKELEGTLTARMGAGGKFGTTALDNARMGLASSLTRDLEGIDAGFSGLFSELAIGRGGAMAEGENRLAAFQQGRSEQESELTRMLAGTIRQPKPGMLGGILGATGMGLGGMVGGPMGASMGGEFGSAIGGALERT